MKPSRICRTYPPGALPGLLVVPHSVCPGRSALSRDAKESLRPSLCPRIRSLQNLSRKESRLPFHSCIPGRRSFPFLSLPLFRRRLLDKRSRCRRGGFRLEPEYGGEPPPNHLSDKESHVDPGSRDGVGDG